MFVKGPHTADVAASLRPVLGPDTTVVTLQNGWGNADVLARAVPAERLVVGVTYEGATIIEPGVVRRTGVATTKVGPYMIGGSTDRAAAIAELHAAAGFACEGREDVVTAIWRKLIRNAAVLPVAALTRLRGAQLVDTPVDVVVDQLIHEAVEVARANGYDIDEAEGREWIHTVLGGSGRSTPSMLADVETTRSTEIDFVNGAVVRAAAAVGMTAPLHDLMVTLTHGLERSWVE